MSHIIAVAWFRGDQWSRLRELSSDRDEMETEYEEWQTNAENQVAGLRGQGLHVRKIDVDLDELAGWCKSEKVPVNAASRSRYAAYRAQRDDSRE
jgi:hypothetical protein